MIGVGTVPMLLWGVGTTTASTWSVVLASTPGASWCGTIVVVPRMFGVELVPADDVADSGEPAFLFEAVNGSAVPLSLEPESRQPGGDSSLSVRSHRPAALKGIPKGLFIQKGSA